MRTKMSTGQLKVCGEIFIYYRMLSWEENVFIGTFQDNSC